MAPSRFPPLLRLILFFVGPFAGLERAAQAAEGVDAVEPPPVQMEAVAVKGDVFRTLGTHGVIHGNLGSLVGAHNVRCQITAVNPASPAFRSGLRAGDELLGVAGKGMNAYSIYGLRAVLQEALRAGRAFDCLVDAPGRGRRTVSFQAMAEPKHLWLPAPPPAPPPGTEPLAPGSAAPLWRNAGRASAMACLETLLWARHRHDPDAIAVCLDPDDPALEPMRVLFAALPESGRAYYRSPARMLAVFVSQEMPPAETKSRQTSLRSDRASCALELRFAEPTDVRTLRRVFRFVRRGDTWCWSPARDALRDYAEFYRGVPFGLATPDAVPAIAWFFQSY
ncbi:PDZ domain-containing protein [Opitutus sp. ER46]|uniref:PDZ domain-containing protein n=1 Tax=Opitutus sp. ER46 TaxID=2161864 RepID=UPI000D2FF1D4|nr:PDZ domain-containing protein [Opitutus sp. ER46]PTX96601.1 hypothetical protein DB354_08060 [Opitutus sp. ER46]